MLNSLLSSAQPYSPPRLFPVRATSPSLFSPPHGPSLTEPPPSSPLPSPPATLLPPHPPTCTPPSRTATATRRCPRTADLSYKSTCPLLNCVIASALLFIPLHHCSSLLQLLQSKAPPPLRRASTPLTRRPAKRVRRPSEHLMTSTSRPTELLHAGILEFPSVTTRSSCHPLLLRLPGSSLPSHSFSWSFPLLPDSPNRSSVSPGLYTPCVIVRRRACSLPSTAVAPRPPHTLRAHSCTLTLHPGCSNPLARA